MSQANRVFENPTAFPMEAQDGDHFVFEAVSNFNEFEDLLPRTITPSDEAIWRGRIGIIDQLKPDKFYGRLTELKLTLRSIQQVTDRSGRIKVQATTGANIGRTTTIAPTEGGRSLNSRLKQIEPVREL